MAGFRFASARSGSVSYSSSYSNSSSIPPRRFTHNVSKLPAAPDALLRFVLPPFLSSVALAKQEGGPEPQNSLQTQTAALTPLPFFHARSITFDYCSIDQMLVASTSSFVLYDSMQKRAAEFFAGIGLMRMGLDKEGWTTAWANDIDEKKWEMYRAQFGIEDCHFALGDVHKIDGSYMPAIESATASFPCNDLSLAGSRNGLAGTHSSAFWGFIDVLKTMGTRRPPLVLLENVAGFLTSNDGNDFRDALVALNELGYAVDAFIIDASRFVPQSRVRLFVVGSKASGSEARVNEIGLLQSDCRPAALADFIFMNPDIGWNIRRLPALPISSLKLADIIEDVPTNSAIWWSQERCDYLLNQMSDRHRAEAERMIAGTKWSYGTVFRRVRNGRSMGELRTDGIAGCLRTPRGGSGRQILFCGGKGQFRVRLLTPKECARLMGANEFKINVPLNQALFGFGDAVCVPVIQWIAHHYLNPALEELQQLALPLPSSRRNVVYSAKKRKTLPLKK